MSGRPSSPQCSSFLQFFLALSSMFILPDEFKNISGKFPPNPNVTLWLQLQCFYISVSLGRMNMFIRLNLPTSGQGILCIQLHIPFIVFYRCCFLKARSWSFLLEVVTKHCLFVVIMNGLLSYHLFYFSGMLHNFPQPCDQIVGIQGGSWRWLEAWQKPSHWGLSTMLVAWILSYTGGF